MSILYRAAALMLVVPAVISACDRAPAEEPSASSGVAPPALSMDTGLAAFLHDGPIELGSSRTSIVARLGQPDSVVARTVANRHDPAVTDSVFELHYDGLTAELYRAGYDGKEMLTGLVISDARYMTPTATVRPGAPAADVVGEFGEPTDVDEAGPPTGGTRRLRYLCDECLVSGHEIVVFTVAEGVVRTIRIQYWIE